MLLLISLILKAVVIFQNAKLFQIERTLSHIPAAVLPDTPPTYTPCFLSRILLYSQYCDTQSIFYCLPGPHCFESIAQEVYIHQKFSSFFLCSYFVEDPCSTFLLLIISPFLKCFLTCIRRNISVNTQCVNLLLPLQWSPQIIINI